MRRVGLILLAFILLSTSLTACYDAKEIDNWAYVYSIGVDRGVSNALRFTFQIPALKQGNLDTGGGVSAGQEEENDSRSYATIAIDAPSFYSAVNMAETSFSRALNYMHTTYLVISEELAREGVGLFINDMIRSRQIRRIMYIIIVKDKASRFVEEFDPVLTGAISKAQEGFIHQKDESGFIIDTSYHNFIRDLKTTYRMAAAPLAALNDNSNFRLDGPPPENSRPEGDYYAGEIPRRGGNKVEFMGTALFDGEKMVGQLTGNETRAMLMLKGEFTRAAISIDDPKKKNSRVTINTKLQKKPDITVDVSGEKPLVNVKLSLEGDILGLQSAVEYESSKLKLELEKAFKEYMKGQVDKTIDKCRALGVDVFGFGEKAVTHFLTIQEWEEYNWLGQFKDAEITTEVDFVVRRTGTLLKTNPIRNSQGVEE